jgi:hypothetical protein
LIDYFLMYGSDDLLIFIFRGVIPSQLDKKKRKMTPMVTDLSDFGPKYIFFIYIRDTGFQINFVIKPFKPKLDFANRVYYTVCKPNPNLSSGIKISFWNFSILLAIMVNLFIIISVFTIIKLCLSYKPVFLI